MLLTFDAAKHHIGLAEVDGDELFGFLVAGSYSRAFRREKQSEFDGVRYGGGDALVNKPGVSSWTQDDFSGGAFQYVYGKDQAMFARSSNALPSQFDRSIRSVPPLQQWLNGKRLATTEIPMLVCVNDGYLVAVFRTKMSRWSLTDGTYSEDVLDTEAGQAMVACFLRDQGRVYKSQNATVSRYNLATFSGWESTFGPPSGAVGYVTGLSADGDRLCIAYQDVLWAVKLPDDRVSAPPGANFTRIGRLPGRWVASCYSSGLLYVLLSGKDTQTQLVAFDGTQILPITDFPYNFVGESITVYGGRVYVGGSGRDIQSSAAKYAELYEVTGSSLRLLKTFAPEQRGAGDVVGKSIPSMAVHEGLLFFGLKGVGLCAYDLTTDAFYGASTFAPADSTSEMHRLASGRESLFSWVYPIAANPGNGGWFRPATSQETVSSYLTEVETSDFATAFDRKKRWRQLRALVRFPAGALDVKYSVDGGLTWSASISPTTETNGRFRLETFDLSSVPESRTIRFKFLMPNGTDVAAFRELVGFTASFRFLDSDSVGSGEKEKLAWTFVVNGTDRVEGVDRSEVKQDVGLLHDLIWSWARERKQLRFRDADGAIFTVEIDTCEETQPFILSAVNDEDAFGPRSTADREAFYRVTLVEV